MSFMNILPEKVLRTKNQDGSITTSELYSWDAFVNTQMYPILTLIGIGLIFAPFLAGLLLACYCWEIHRNPILINIAAIIVSTYLLIDIHNSWFLTSILEWSTTHDKIVKIVYLNGAMILTHLTLIFLGSKIFNMVSSRFIIDPDIPHKNDLQIKLICMVLILVMSLLYFLISTAFISTNIISIF